MSKKQQELIESYHNLEISKKESELNLQRDIARIENEKQALDSELRG